MINNASSFRRRILDDLIQLEHDPLIAEEILDIEERLRNLPEHFLKDSTNIEMKRTSKSARAKMRETRFRIARPFDKEFGLTTCFEHQHIVPSDMHGVDEIEERFIDLARIMLNIIKFSKVENFIEDTEDQKIIDEAESLLPRLKQNESLEESVELYNHFLTIIQWFQPIIKQYFERHFAF